MPKTSAQFKEIRDERRESILFASIPVFVENGKKKTTVDKICQRAKCSHGLLYHYFKDTNDVFEALKSLKQYKKLEKLLDEKNKDTGSEMLDKYIDAFSNSLKKTKDTLIASFFLEYGNSFNYLMTAIKQGQKDGDFIEGEPFEMALAIEYIYRGIFSKTLSKHSVIRVPSPETIRSILVETVRLF